MRTEGTLDSALYLRSRQQFVTFNISSVIFRRCASTSIGAYPMVISKFEVTICDFQFSTTTTTGFYKVRGYCHAFHADTDHTPQQSKPDTQTLSTLPTWADTHNFTCMGNQPENYPENRPKDLNQWHYKWHYGTKGYQRSVNWRHT